MKTTELLYTTNNSYDSILLVRDGIVCSSWPVTMDDSGLRDFIAASDPADWESMHLDEFAQPNRPEDYGQILARNGRALPGCEEIFRTRCEFYLGRRTARANK